MRFSQSGIILSHEITATFDNVRSTLVQQVLGAKSRVLNNAATGKDHKLADVNTIAHIERDFGNLSEAVNYVVRHYPLHTAAITRVNNPTYPQWVICIPTEESGT